MNVKMGNFNKLLYVDPVSYYYTVGDSQFLLYGIFEMINKK